MINANFEDVTYSAVLHNRCSVFLLPAQHQRRPSHLLVAQWRRGDVSYIPAVSIDCCLFTD